MKKIIVLIIVLYSFCFMEKAGAQTCLDCEIDVVIFNPFFGDEYYTYCTNERSKTLSAGNELFAYRFDNIPECSDVCCFDDSFSVCTDGSINLAGAPVNYGRWDVICYDTDTDGIPDDGDNSTVSGDNTCTDGNIINCDDNCRLMSNPSQEDVDSDGAGDVCDNCLSDWNPGQWDSDADGTGDACDSEPDLDNDGVTDTYDNCPDVSNHWQHDFDGDESGNACDPVLNGGYVLRYEEEFSAMAGITEVTGKLSIVVPNLTSLAGLENITRISGNLRIEGNDSLTSLTPQDEWPQS